MNPIIFKFEDEVKAINFYKVILKKIHAISIQSTSIWYEVAIQSSNLTKLHIVTINTGSYKKVKNNYTFNEHKDNKKSEIHSGNNINF